MVCTRVPKKKHKDRQDNLLRKLSVNPMCIAVYAMLMMFSSFPFSVSES